MEALKICLGCFREWEEGKQRCPCCGWESGKEYEEIFGWKQGGVFAKRYLLGMAYCRTEHAAVWRIYDKVLGISCFALQREDSDKPLYPLAVRLRKAGCAGENQVKLLVARELGGKDALLFSMKDLEGKQEILEAVLEAEETEPEPAEDSVKPEVEEQKRDQVLPSGTLLDGRYRILECIGIGGFGILYLCRDLGLRRMVAVKEYFPAEWAERDETYVTVKKSQMLEAYWYGMQSFYKEARISARFIHTPHMVTIYDVLEANDTVYLVMEYISGISVGRAMRARGYQPYSTGEMAELLFPVMEALEAVHEEKIIHSDISPGNIMRSDEGEIFLIDMGAAKYALDSEPALSAAFLKLDYAAPEQYRTAREGIPKDEGPWTDVYALGATMYYLLTGEKPPDVMRRLGAKDTAIRFSGKCRWKHRRKWKKLLNRAMSLEIRERIGTVAELREGVRALLK